MSLTCADLSERLVDYLYEGLGAEERQRIEEHLSGCEACRAEVAGLGRTLVRTRQALRGSLSEDAPSRVRAEIMQAARSAVPALAGPPVMAGAALPGRSRPQRQEEVSRGPGPGAAWWGWVRRPWFFPAFAAASALALFFIARPALMKPPAPTSFEESAAPGVAQESPTAAPAAEPVAPEKSVEPEESVPASARGEAPRQIARPTPRPRRARAELADDGLRGPPAEGRDVARAKRSAAAEEGSARFATPPPMPQAASMPRRAVAEAEADDQTVEAASGKAESERKGRIGGVVGGLAGGVADSNSASAPPLSADPAVPADRALATLSFTELQERATDAEREGRKPAAAAALRELLRRFPDHRDAPRWRTRLQAALR